jgi:hypothetical protein
MATSELVDPVPVNPVASPYAVASGDTQRKKAIADLLLKQGLQGAGAGQMVSGHYIAPALTQQLAPLLQVLASRRLNTQANQSQYALAGQYGQAQSKAASDFYDAYKENPRQAIIKAMASPYPAVQSAAKDLLGKTLGASDAASLVDKGFTGTSVGQFANSNDPTQLNKTTIQTGNDPIRTVNTSGTGGVSVGLPNQPKLFDQPTMGPGGVPLQTSLVTGQAQFGHPKEFTSVNVAQMPGNVALDTGAKLSYDSLAESRKVALGAQQALAGMQGARNILANGQLWQNYGAEYVPEVKSVLAALGTPLTAADEVKLRNAKGAQNVLLNATMQAALEADSARGMNSKLESTSIAASAADENLPLAARIGAADAAIGGLANKVNQHHNNVIQTTTLPPIDTSMPPEMQNVVKAQQAQLSSANGLVRQSMDVQPVTLDPNLYSKDANGLYQLKPAQLGAVPGSQPGQGAPNANLSPALAGAQPPNSAPAPTSPAAPLSFHYDAQGNRIP